MAIDILFTIFHSFHFRIISHKLFSAFPSKSSHLNEQHEKKEARLSINKHSPRNASNHLMDFPLARPRHSAAEDGKFSQRPLASCPLVVEIYLGGKYIFQFSHRTGATSRISMMMAAVSMSSRVRSWPFFYSLYDSIFHLLATRFSRVSENCQSRRKIFIPRKQQRAREQRQRRANERRKNFYNGQSAAAASALLL
jgi:hypothetical protein